AGAQAGYGDAAGERGGDELAQRALGLQRREALGGLGDDLRRDGGIHAAAGERRGQRVAVDRARGRRRRCGGGRRLGLRGRRGSARGIQLGRRPRGRRRLGRGGLGGRGRRLDRLR